MKRLIAPWTSALATAALIALPAIGSAQTPQTEATPPEPQPQQSTTLSTPTDTSAGEHLRLAKEALAAVDVSSVPARAKSQMAELRRHISSLERSVEANDKASTTGAARRSTPAGKARSGASWANDVAAIDRIITQLAGDAPATGATEPGAVGTSGSKSKESTAVTLDENTRSQLLEVRKHVTEFAAAMSGTGSQSQTSSAATSHQPTPSAAGETAAATGQTPSAGQAASTTESTAPATGTTGTTGQTPATSSGQAGQTSPTGTAGQTPPAGEQQTETTPATQANVALEAARQHLTAARNSLTQLTQLPAAAQLQGDARTQVSQLIQNFNELITSQTDWRPAYDKVEANLTALIGPAPQKSTSATMPSTEPTATPTPTPEPAPANPPTAPATPTEPQAGTQGTQGTQQPEAVGTSGAATLDPAIRQKLTEFREHLQKFHDVAEGEAK